MVHPCRSRVASKGLRFQPAESPVGLIITRQLGSDHCISLKFPGVFASTSNRRSVGDLNVISTVPEPEKADQSLWGQFGSQKMASRFFHELSTPDFEQGVTHGSARILTEIETHYRHAGFGYRRKPGR